MRAWFRLGVVCALCSSGVALAAWNPLRWLENAFNNAGASAGNVLATVTAPTLANAETAGAGVVDALDASLANQIKNASGAGDTLIKTAAGLAGAGLDRADRMMAARILDLKLVGQDLTADLVGRVDDVSRARLAQAIAGGEKIVDKLDAAAQSALNRVDTLLLERTNTLGVMLRQTIAELDQALERRITQADELTERRLGNVDVLSTKAGLQAERIALRLFTLLGLFVFLAFALWRAYVEVVNASDEAYELLERKAINEQQRNRHVVKTAAVKVAVQLGGAVVCAGLLLWVGAKLPMGATADAATLEATQRVALRNAVAAMDLTRARYHASQLLILRPDEAQQHAQEVARVELLRDLFTRPTLLHSPDGLRQVVARLQQLEATHPDVLTARAFVSWSVSGTRDGEKEAAELCARALESHQPFTLEPLAQHYVRAYLHHPFAMDDALARRLRAVATKTPLVFPPLQHVLDTGAALTALDDAVSPSFLELLDAHARVLEAGATADAVAAARADRVRHARAIVKAFAQFETDVISNGTLRGTTAPLAAFWVNDAVLPFAAWVLQNPNGGELRPASLPEKLQDRLVLAPPRIQWARSLFPELGTNVAAMLGAQESARFVELQGATLAFARDYVELRRQELRRTTPAQLVPLRRQAALSAARAGLRTSQGDNAMRPLSEVLARDSGEGIPPDAAAVLEAAARQRSFRVL